MPAPKIEPDEDSTKRRNRRAIVVVVDRWGAEYLGPYGNTWLETPSANRMAADMMLMEQAIAESTDLRQVYRAFWQGSARNADPPAYNRLLEACHATGLTTSLITDDEEVAKTPLASAFQRSFLVPAKRSRRLASAEVNTGLARLFAEAMTHLEDDAAGLTWIHCRGMEGEWDAPWQYRAQFADEQDPDPPTGVSIPRGPVPPDSDPDLLLGWVWAYAGQVALLDECLRPVLEAWRQASDPTLFVVMGARGFALGEHGQWGGDATKLHSPRVHVPLFVGSSAHDLARVRCQQLAQSRHLFATVADWFELPISPQLPSVSNERPVKAEGKPHDSGGNEESTPGPFATEVRDQADASQKAANQDDSLFTLCDNDYLLGWADWPPLAVSRDDDQWMLRTSVWCAVIDASPSDAVVKPKPADRAGAATRAIELYLKPDDVWDTNDVAALCPEVVAEFVKLQQRLATLPTAAGFNSVLPLHSLLVTRPR